MYEKYHNNCVLNRRHSKIVLWTLQNEQAILKAIS